MAIKRIGWIYPWIGVVLLALCLTASAGAATGWQPYRLPRAAHDVPVVHAECGGSAGCFAYTDAVTLAQAAQGGTFTLLIGQPKVPLEEQVYLHELGHWFDWHAMTPPAREAFEAIIGVARDWMAGFDPPGEKFAQAFMLCALYPVAPKRWPTRPTWQTTGYSYAPSLKQHRSACALIAAVAAPA